MNLDLADRRILVCGASAGLGQAVAEALADEGARLALNARDTPRLVATAERLGHATAPADLADEHGPAAAVRAAADALGGLDGVLVNAGGPPPGDFEQLDDEAWATAIDRTLMSAVRLIRASIEPLRDGRSPAIVVILSSSVRSPIPELTSSNVLRPGLVGLVKTLSVELAPHIRINGVAPGRLDTDRVGTLDSARAERAGTTTDEIRRVAERAIPLGRYGRPRELGDVVAFLLSERASYVTGQILSVDGGSAKTLP